jgi:purine-cytosine permease-like protein
MTYLLGYDERSAAMGGTVVQPVAPAGSGDALQVGTIEARGVDYIPHAERKSHPRNLAWAMFGPQFGFGNMFFGSLVIVFGLGWWSGVTAILVGVTIGSLIFAGMALMAPKSGTNNATTSGAFFGITGRYLGSALSILIALGFTAILVWTSGQTIVVVFDRILGTGTGDLQLSIAMAVVALIAFAAAIYGHDTIASMFKIISITSFIVCVLSVIVLSNKFHAVPGGHYALGTFWPTWVLGVVVTASLPISWGPFIGDYGRYMPPESSGRQLAGWAFLGMFGGCLISLLIGAYVTTTFSDPTTLLATGYPSVAPLWLAILLMLTAGGLSNIESATMSIYNAGIDLQSIFWRFSRTQLTFVISAVALVVSYVALIGYNAISSVEAFVTLILAFVTPWLVIMVVGHLHRGGRYHTLDLQAFRVPGEKGAYWFSGGVNPRAAIAWLVASGVGLLFSETSIITGPLPKHISGIDLSFTSAAVVGAGLYYALLKLWPEQGVIPGEAAAPGAPRTLGMAE